MHDGSPQQDRANNVAVKLNLMQRDGANLYGSTTGIFAERRDRLTPFGHLSLATQ